MLIKHLAAKEKVELVVVECSLETVAAFEFGFVALIGGLKDVPSAVRASENCQFGHTVHGFLSNTAV